MKTHGRVILLLAAAASALSFAPAQEPGVLVNAIKFSPPQVDDLAHLLGVVRIGGEYDLRGVTNRAGLLFEIHKKGKKSGDPIRGSFLAGRQERERKGRFSIQIADLDFLKLGDAPRGHHRLLIALEEGGVSCRGGADIPKTVFDFTTVRGGGTFPSDRAERGRIPLFYRVSGTVEAIKASETPEAAIKNHPDADVLTAYLEVE